MIWEETAPSFLWKEVTRRGGGWLPQRDEMKCKTARSLVSSSRAQPRDLFCRRENSTYEEVRHSKSYEVRCLPLISHSPFHRCARKISRFARNDDAGKALLSFSTCLRRILLSLSYREHPIRPFGAPSPQGEGFWCGAAVFSFRRLLHGGKDFGLLPPSSGRRCPEGAEVGSRSGMRRKVRQPILPFRHPERSRGIFPVAAVYDMHAAAQKIARALISHSPFHRCARKISRFARNGDAGKALLSFSTCLRRILLSLSCRQCPIRPFRAPSPRGEGYS